MLLWELGRIGRMSQFHMGEAVYPYALLAPFVLSTAVSIALTALMALLPHMARPGDHVVSQQHANRCSDLVVMGLGFKAHGLTPLSSDSQA